MKILWNFACDSKILMANIFFFCKLLKKYLEIKKAIYREDVHDFSKIFERPTEELTL